MKDLFFWYIRNFLMSSDCFFCDVMEVDLLIFNYIFRKVSLGRSLIFLNGNIDFFFWNIGRGNYKLIKMINFRNFLVYELF